MTELDTGTPRLVTDFNSVRDGETLLARLDLNRSASLPSEGERVDLFDPEGNHCDGVIVAAVNDQSYRVRPIWGTWVDGDVEETRGVIDIMEALKRSVSQLSQVEGTTKTQSADKVEEFTVKLG